jgi:hypothetical protein
MSAPAPSVSAAKHEVLHGLARAVAALAGRIQGHGKSAHEVGLLTARAEELAARAWAIACSSRTDKEAAAALAAAANAFVQHAIALSQRVAREASTSMALVSILRGEAKELQAVGRELVGVNDMIMIRARLRPLLDRLLAIPERLEAVTDFAADIAELGDMARAISERTQGLQESGRPPAVISVALYKELRGFARASGSVANKLWEDDKQMQQAIAQMHEQTNWLVSPEAAAEAQRNASAIGRMHDTIIRTKTTALRVSPSGSPKSRRGMGWGYASRPPR